MATATGLLTAPQFRIKDKFGTITVYTRNHIGGCPLTDPNQNDCACPKWLYANRKGHSPKRYAAETPSFPEACEIAKTEHDGWHPEIAAARAAAAKRERKKKRIADAVAELIADRQVAGALGTRDANRSTLGHVDENGRVRGHFLVWLEEINRTLSSYERIEYMDQLDHILIGQFKRWAMPRFNSDLTRKQFWSKIRGFFFWAQQSGFCDNNPALNHKSPQHKKGNRCGAFTDQQFEDILAVIPAYAREHYASGRLLPSSPYRKVLEQRLTTFVLLLRYSGMALVDGVLFSPFVGTDGLGLSDDGVLRYRRQKTNELAVVPIESRDLLEMVRSGIPLEKYSDPHRPFSPLNINAENKRDMDSLTQKLARQLKSLYKLAGITKVKTEVGFKTPHSHMFRDTFAKWHLNRHTDIRDLAKMLGHASVKTTQEHYASWLEEDQQAMIDRVLARNSRLPDNLVRMPSRLQA